MESGRLWSCSRPAKAAPGIVLSLRQKFLVLIYKQYTSTPYTYRIMVVVRDVCPSPSRIFEPGILN